MNSSDQQRYRNIGGRLAIYLRRRDYVIPEARVLDAIAADFAGDDADLVLPLKTMLAKPGFHNVARLAGSGGGTAERLGLLQELRVTFSEEIIDAMRIVLDGFLDLPAESHHSKLLAGGLKKADYPESLQKIKPNPDKKAVDTVRRQDFKHTNKRKHLGGLLILSAASAVGLILSQANLYCRFSGNCSAQDKQVGDAQSDALSTTQPEPGKALDTTGKGPRYGHPVYDPSDGYHWTFYKHINGTDWYLDPKSKTYDVPGGFRIMMREVRPDNINFGPLALNCDSKQYSAYYEEWTNIFPSREENLVTSLYKTNCNLPASNT